MPGPDLLRFHDMAAITPTAADIWGLFLVGPAPMRAGEEAGPSVVTWGKVKKPEKDARRGGAGCSGPAGGDVLLWVR
jgi:hypothetical protein